MPVGPTPLNAVGEFQGDGLPFELEQCNRIHRRQLCDGWAEGATSNLCQLTALLGGLQVLCKYIQMSAAALARRQEATEKALAECVDTVASLAAAQAKVPRAGPLNSFHESWDCQVMMLGVLLQRIAG